MLTLEWDSKHDYISRCWFSDSNIWYPTWNNNYRFICLFL